MPSGPGELPLSLEFMAEITSWTVNGWASISDVLFVTDGMNCDRSVVWWLEEGASQSCL